MAAVAAGEEPVHPWANWDPTEGNGTELKVSPNATGPRDPGQQGQPLQGATRGAARVAKERLQGERLKKELWEDGEGGV